MISYTIFIAIVFTTIGSFTTTCRMSRDIRRLVRTHKNEIYTERIIWHRAGWQDGIAYQKSKQYFQELTKEKR